jgi:phospholipid/cholesterol/gamma-HCH transport system substrate-binding protein
MKRALLGILAAALLATGCSSLFGNGAYTVEVQLDRTFNLFPGSPVRVLGVKVGVITDIGVREGDDFVTAVLDIGDESRLIPADGSAVIVTESLLGERFIQLDPFEQGDEPAPTTGHVIELENTKVPAEFDEVLEGLNKFVGGLNPQDVARFFSNLAGVLEGNGERIGNTIEQARTAVNVLQEHDEELVNLAGRLADLNETLGTRDQALGEIINDWNTVASTIVAERGDLDQALAGLARFSDALGDLLTEHRPGLEDDIETVTRIGRTAVRGLGELERAAVYTAELFRHAERVVTREPNYWLPLLNAAGSLATTPVEGVNESLLRRIAANCEGLGLPGCDVLLSSLGGVCIPVLNCEEAQMSAGEALVEIHDFSPELFDRLLEQNSLNDTGDGLLLDMLGGGAQ